jgi:phosphoglycerate dehydrogenase-like enzyme
VLDVFQTEPLPPESPFWLHPRVAANPHASAMGSGLDERSRVLFLENLGRFMAGEPLLNEAAPSDVLAR